MTAPPDGVAPHTPGEAVVPISGPIEVANQAGPVLHAP